MSAPVVILATIALIALSAFFVVIEFALIGARRHRLEALAPTDRSARAALRGMNDLTMMLATAQLGITACTFALGAITKPAMDYALRDVLLGWNVPSWLAGGSSFALSLFVVTFLHLVVGEMAPKSWAIAHPETAARLVSLPARGVMRVFQPLLTLINRLANRLVARAGVTPVDRAAVGGRDVATIRSLVEHSEQVGVLEPELRSQISHALDLQQLGLADLAQASSTASGVPLEASVAEVAQEARSSGHLRVLLLDAAGVPVQVVHVRDTLLLPGEAPAAPVARPVLALDAAVPAWEALTEMRENSAQLAVVRDGDRHVVVTISDLVTRLLPVATA
ncbi:CNNM domain-containing protein [Litorihabitans aurantiacus]|uniref:Membrane protein n=1 Tax=Litorihabitans aurantiacus TaxID=1930061 RepID=A0AA38CWE7_9MICO|nr:hemolysin family protein [Litorihabitans aurantiacus]GMA33042.1 membrane protein [Litorihabitans aurantiacus]